MKHGRKSDGRRVENKIPIGLVRDLADQRTAWAEVERLHLPINSVDSRRGVTFGRPRTALRRTRTGRAVRVYPPKGAYHDKRLRQRLPKPLVPEMGQQNRAVEITRGQSVHECCQYSPQRGTLCRLSHLLATNQPAFARETNQLSGRRRDCIAVQPPELGDTLVIGV
jgi:hypothetical protein